MVDIHNLNIKSFVMLDEGRGRLVIFILIVPSNDCNNRKNNNRLIDLRSSIRYKQKSDFHQAFIK